MTSSTPLAVRVLLPQVAAGLKESLYPRPARARSGDLTNFCDYC